MAEKTVLFDIGNVLVTFDFSKATSRVGTKSQVSAEAVLETISDIKDEFESGRMEGEPFFHEAMARLGFSGTLEEFEEAWCDIFEVNQPMLDTLQWIDGLAERPRLLLLSNTNEPHRRWLFERFPEVFQRFHGGVYSHQAQCMKPHDEIYEKLIADWSVDPEQTFYIDDLPANIVAGKRFGLHSHEYAPTDHPSFAQALSEWLVHHNPRSPSSHRLA
jgi:putative hydrolase of the HAD superfamily